MGWVALGQPIIWHKRKKNYESGTITSSQKRSQSILQKPPPPNRRKHPTRNRNPPKIHLHPRLTNTLDHHRRQNRGNLHTRPQQRSLHRQHPAQRRQHPNRLRRSPQQSHHLRLIQNQPQLPGIHRRMPRSRPNKPAELPWPNPLRPHNPHIPSHSPLTRTRRQPPQPPRPKPCRQPLHPPQNLAETPIQQQPQQSTQPPPNSPTAHRPTQRADHVRQVQNRGDQRVHDAFRSMQQNRTQQEHAPETQTPGLSRETARPHQSRHAKRSPACRLAAKRAPSHSGHAATRARKLSRCSPSAARSVARPAAIAT